MDKRPHSAMDTTSTTSRSRLPLLIFRRDICARIVALGDDLVRRRLHIPIGLISARLWLLLCRCWRRWLRTLRFFSWLIAHFCLQFSRCRQVPVPHQQQQEQDCYSNNRDIHGPVATVERL